MPLLHLAFLRVIVLLAALSLTACVSRPLSPNAQQTSDAVVLVSLDGVGADRLGRGLTPTLDAMARNGVRARWLQPMFPTLTFPNHYSIVTGLRPDRHGIINNNMRDPALGDFGMKLPGSRDGRWWGGEPIWATLQRQGGIAATMFWPGTEAEIAGVRPRHWRPFAHGFPMDARVDQVLAWLDLPPGQRPQLITLYFEHFDEAAHAAGVDSPQARSALQTVDAGIARLLDGLSQRGLRGRTDVIVVSDHGMADVPRGNIRYLDDLVAADAFDMVWRGHTAGVVMATPPPSSRLSAPTTTRSPPSGPLPKAGKTHVVETALLGRKDHYACWRKAELPAAWHYGAHPRIPAIVCQADVGWRLSTHARQPPPQPVKAEHGFAPEAPEMRALLIADGPSFVDGAVLPPVDNIDVYPLLARLLHITPAANDGDATALLPGLRRPDQSPSKTRKASR